ncbi:hypothetical protein D3C79_1106630 [compost metagenome]
MHHTRIDQDHGASRHLLVALAADIGTASASDRAKGEALVRMRRITDLAAIGDATCFDEG